MKASDLRIGNWIEVFYGSGDKLYQQVDFISENLIECKPNLNIYGNTIKYKPIPLTEEWLLKFGFEKESWIEFSYRFPHVDGSVNGWVKDNVYCFIPFSLYICKK